MRLFEIEELLVHSLNLEHFKDKHKESLQKMLDDCDSEFYSEIKSDLSQELEPGNLKIEYSSSEFHFNNVDGNGSFVRLKYLLYLPNETMPLYKYDVDLDSTGKLLDDYLIEW